MQQHTAKITVAEFADICDQRLPFARAMGLQLESIDTGCVIMRAVYSEDFLRPGGTIAGPVMMGLADAAMYALVLAHVGPVELAVTTSLNINFLLKPGAGDILAKATPLKFGKRLAIGEISLFGEQQPEQLVAHATATYSIPPPGSTPSGQ